MSMIYHLKIDTLRIYTLYFLIIFAYVGVYPLSEKSFDLTADDTGGGNFLRQLVYLLIFSVSVYATGIPAAKDLIRKCAPIFFVFLLCLVSLLWSDVQSIAFRRVILFIIISYSLFALVSTIKAEDVFIVVLNSHIILILLSVFFVFIHPGAVHQSAQLFDTGLEGNWKGVFQHKNDAGPAALFLLIFLISAKRRFSKLSFYTLMIICIVFIAAAKSKTTIGLAVPCLFVGYIFSKAIKAKIKMAYSAIFLTIFCSTFLILPSFYDDFLILLDNPESFTGRSLIWSLTFPAILDNFWLGIGYGSTWYVGDDNILRLYATGWADWVYVASQGHNGYFDILLSIGFIGLVLVLTNMVFIPLFKWLNSTQSSPSELFLIGSLFSFFIMHNFLETSLLVGDRGEWIVYFIFCMLAYLGNFRIVR